ncbi:MAG: hypothetical protein M1830_000498 [Pleopsidium flavum]|nr:MAG: hypothetical protein M1830_002865 [Pleopsidium flavum]KAI9878587.1 MAG: hypothetical protein M1830_000498 [Pleopsidium flavum]
MLPIPFRRLHRRSIRITFIVLLVFGFHDLLSLSRTPSRQRLHTVNRHKTSREKIFIASTHWNNGYVLKNHWNAAVVDLVKHFGPENIYISIYESGSWDDTKEALRVLDRELEDLQVQRTIVLDETSHADELAKPPASTGWIDTPRGKKELRRIPYLAKLRNLSLKPLGELALNGITFDKVLFLNDVIFKTEDVVNLLLTRDGDYAAACSLDFSKPPAYYDTFALRDSEGHEAVNPIFPYFRSRASRKAIMAHEPVPVQSCWNGMVVFDATPFYGNSDALLFRGIPDSLAEYHLEASECCLIHADNPLTARRGVWLNSNVRVGRMEESASPVVYFYLAADLADIKKGPGMGGS